MIRHNDWTIDRKTLTITHRGCTYVFSARKGNERKHIEQGVSGRFTVLEHLILSGGRATSTQLFSRLYDHDPEGGPLKGHEQIKIMLHQIQREVLPRLSAVLIKDRRAGRMWYEIKPFSVAETAQKIIDVVRRSA